MSKKKELIEDIPPVPVKDRSNLGKVSIFLDEGTEITAVGVVYGIGHNISGENFRAELFLDHFNQRIKINHYEGDLETIIFKVRSIADINNFDKIICYATKKDWQAFLKHGYVLEAVIKYHARGEDTFVVSKFRSQERLTSHALLEEIMLVEDIMNQEQRQEKRNLPHGIILRHAKRDDIPQLISLYTDIFETYPSPLIHSDYLETVFGKDAIFVVAEKDGEIIAGASAELDHERKAAELTDCATRPKARGLGLMSHILKMLEDKIKEKGFITAYTMARGRSYGMNVVFYHLGYEFMGRLVNNCDIFGTYEDMNIWVRPL